MQSISQINNHNSSLSKQLLFDGLKQLVLSLTVGVCSSIVLVFIILLLSSNAKANSVTELKQEKVKLHDVSQGSLLFSDDNSVGYTQAPVLDTQVDIKISGIIARSKLIQSFSNPNDHWVEGVYVFPLPENAAVDHMRLKIGERIIEGQIKERQDAKRIYNKAKREGKKTSLIEQERPNMFTTSVANIAPHETISVEIEYQQILQFKKSLHSGQFELRFPMTITPRYIPGKKVVTQETIDEFNNNGWSTTQVPDASRITPSFTTNHQNSDDFSNKLHNPIKMHIILNAGFPIRQLNSSFHKINTSYLSEEQVSIHLANEQVAMDRDFVLSWNTEVGSAPKAALFSQQLDKDDYHLLMLMPPTDSVKGGQPLSREVIYIIDTSGSMEGESIIQAKDAVLMALDRLRPQDSFNVIQFNSDTSLLFKQARPASYDNILNAKRYVNALIANGGTEMYSALDAALTNSSDDQLLRQVIFLTDGSVGNETQLFELIHKRLNQNRLFTVGIGSAPNSFFMSKAAQYGRGTYTYIGDINEIQNKMNSLFEKLENPVLANIALQWNDASAVEFFPKRIPDLYIGEPLIVAIKTNDSNKQLKISGVRANEQWQVDFSLQQGRVGQGVSKLWARQKISTLMDSLNEGANRNDVKKLIVDLGLNHHLVSTYTSLVAVDVTPSRPTEDSLQTSKLKNSLPKGTNKNQLSGIRLAKTATPAQWYLIIGCLLLSLSLVLMCLKRMNHRPKNELFG